MNPSTYVDPLYEEKCILGLYRLKKADQENNLITPKKIDSTQSKKRKYYPSKQLDFSNASIGENWFRLDKVSHPINFTVVYLYSEYADHIYKPTDTYNFIYCPYPTCDYYTIFTPNPNKRTNEINLRNAKRSLKKHLLYGHLMEEFKQSIYVNLDVYTTDTKKCPIINCPHTSEKWLPWHIVRHIVLTKNKTT